MNPLKWLRRNTGNILAILLAIAITAFFIGMGVFFAYESITGVQEYHAITTEGVETRGRFVDKRFTESTDDNGNTSYTYYVTFRFTVGEEAYIVEDDVSYDLYQRADNGEPLSVRYAETNPRVAVLELVMLQDIAIWTFFCICWNGGLIIAAVAFIRAQF